LSFWHVAAVPGVLCCTYSTIVLSCKYNRRGTVKEHSKGVGTVLYHSTTALLWPLSSTLRHSIVLYYRSTRHCQGAQ
jgi:hypothetical protein